MAQTATIDQHVQAELFRRAALLGVRPGRAVLAADIDMIRRIAQQNGMMPVASVAQVLESAVARGEQGPLITGWIALLREAIGSDRQDRFAGDSYVAACSVRLTS
ncbi:hypothetical protein [Sphingomonas sp. 28-63-12]|uniref:hypothetical protein n=1 Tax=Sphingomonas sp. 28-63-12 TaxID=1970434 RepID=UPI000BD31795|nr:MAG: hypothetical protein B7Y47_10550 [Sphingomonas sp. 28-63-12]